MSTLTEILNTRPEDIVAPVPLPHGQYICKISALPTETSDRRTKAGDEMEILEFPVEVLAEVENTIDPELLRAFGEVRGQRLRHSLFYVARADDNQAKEKYKFAIRNFLFNYCKSDAKTIGEALNNCVGLTFIAKVDWEKDANNPEIIRAKIAAAMPVT